jgi:hypothetical protein
MSDPDARIGVALSVQEVERLRDVLDEVVRRGQ